MRFAPSRSTFHIPSRLAVGAAFLIIAAACSGGDDAGTTTTALTTTAAPTTSTIAEVTPDPSPPTTATTAPPTTTTTTTTIPPVSVPTFDDDDQPVPVDDEVVIGTLPNGLTYYIRANDNPGVRAQLRLAVKAGSLQEPDDQRGAAHYLEHMMFNGTERFPSNELIAVLSRFGAEFGPDVNAYTSYEETVYELELSTFDIATLEEGFNVLHEWATAVALDPVEIDLERGVLLEEWRFRDQGFWGRYGVGVTEQLLGGTPYEDRDPLADPDQLQTTTPEGLRAFYETWYRPDTMAVVAVGDFDVDDVEQMIVDRFADIPVPADAAEVPRPVLGPASEPGFFIIADPEFPEAWAELNYPLPPEDSTTVGGLRRGLAGELAWNMLATRLREDTLRGETPFFDSGRAANDLVRAHSTPGLLAWADPDRLGETTHVLLREIRRARIFGFSDDELERAVEEIRSLIQSDFDGRDTRQDARFAGEYVEHFLGGSPIPRADDRFELMSRLLDEMTPDQVWQTWASAVDGSEPFVIIVAPESASEEIPDEAELRQVLASVEVEPIEAWNDPAGEIETLMDRPGLGGVRSRGNFSDTGLTEVTLQNGVRIIAIDTCQPGACISEDRIVFRASSPGGWSGLTPEDVVEAQLAPRIALKSGVGGIDQVSLERALSDQVVSVAPFIDEVEEGIFGESSRGDVETLFQLINLYMSAPQFGEGARDLVISDQLPNAAYVEADPELAVSQAMARARFGGDPRYAAVPAVSELESFDLARASEIYRDRFADAGDFVFAFSGDLDEGEIEDLARRYLGILPDTGRRETFVDTRPDPPARIVAEVVESGTGQLGGVRMLFSTEIALNPEVRVDVDLLELVLRQRLTARIREELSASYSPVAFTRLVEEPVASVEIEFRISADPADLDAIVTAVLAEIADLRDDGPTLDEFFIAQQQLLREYELFSNEGLAGSVMFYAFHPDEGFFELFNRANRVVDATARDVRNLARSLLPANRYIEIRLVPIGMG